MKVSTTNKFFLLMVLVFSANYCFAQYGNKDTIKVNARDTARVASEGKEISKELVLLRDSLASTIAKIRAREGKSTGKGKDKLMQASHTLTLHKQRLDTDIKEVFSQVSAKGWNNALINRLKGDSDDVRREYKRILKDIKDYLAPKS